MKNYFKKPLRVTSAALALAMLFGAACPAFAASDDRKKDENVFVTLNSDGSVQKQTVSVWLHDVNGVSNLADPTSLADVADLKGDLVPTEGQNGLVWDTADQDFYYQGSTDQTLPVNVNIIYFMDGQAMTAEEITGKSGHFAMTVTLTNTEYTSAVIGGRTRRIYSPYACVVGTLLDNDDYKNIKAENGTQQTDSGNTMVGFALMPGMSETFSGLLTGSFSDLNDKLHDSCTLEADVENLQIPSVYIACAASSEELDEMSNFSGDKDDFFADLDDLRDATDELIDGVQELYDGVWNDLAGEDGIGKLEDGTQDLYDGVFGDLTDGVNDLKDGSKELNDKTKELDSKVGELRDKMKPLTEKSAALKGGVKSALDEIFASASAQIDDGLKGLGTSISGITGENAITLDNYATTAPKLRAYVAGAGATAAAELQGSVADAHTLAAIFEAAFPAKCYDTVKEGVLENLYTHYSAAAASLSLEAEEELPDATPETAVSSAESAPGEDLTEDNKTEGTGETTPTEGTTTEGTTTEGTTTEGTTTEGTTTEGTTTEGTTTEGTTTEGTTTEGTTTEGATTEDTTPENDETNSGGDIPAPQDLGTADAPSGSEPGGEELLTNASARDTGALEVRRLRMKLRAAGASAQEELAVVLLGSEVSTQAATPYTDNFENSIKATTAQQLAQLKQTIPLGWEGAYGKYLKETAGTLQTSGQSMIAALDQLEQLVTLYNGIDQYTTGVGQVYDGVNKIKTEGTEKLVADGTQKLYDSVNGKLNDGLNDLRDGTQELYDGVHGDLHDGVNDLKDGTQELLDGVHEYDDEGISKLTDGEDINNLRDLADVAEQLKDKSENHAAYTGSPAGAVCTTKFVMKVSVPEAPEIEEVVSTDNGGNFFQQFVKRFKNLFGLD